MRTNNMKSSSTLQVSRKMIFIDFEMFKKCKIIYLRTKSHNNFLKGHKIK